MKRACYCKNSDSSYHIGHVKSINSNGTIIIEPIRELSNDFVSLESLFMNANRKGYGIIGEFEELKRNNYQKYYEKKCGKNQMDVDEL